LPRIVGKNYSMIPTLVEYLEEDLEMGPYGIKQPKENLKSIDIQDLDAIIVPGISFDKNNYRLGRGKGYYDRFLAKLPSIIPTIGVAFDFQIVDSIPRTKHDVPVSRIIIN